MKIGLRREDALCQSKWSVGVNQIAAGLRSIWPPSLQGKLPDFKHWSFSLSHNYDIKIKKEAIPDGQCTNRSHINCSRLIDPCRLSSALIYDIAVSVFQIDE